MVEDEGFQGLGWGVEGLGVYVRATVILTVASSLRIRVYGRGF